MSFFNLADILLQEGGLFHGTPTLDILVLVVACQVSAAIQSTSRDVNNNPTSLTMSRAAAASFRAQSQYQALVDLCDNGGGVGNVFAAYQRSLPNGSQAAAGFVARSVQYAGVFCQNESCDDVAMTVTFLQSAFYGVDECYPTRHYVKTCRECGSSYYLNKRRQSGPDGTTWHVFYAWDQGTPEEISNKSGKCVLSVAFLTQVALTLSRMRVGFTAICNVYNDTVLRDRGHGSPPLAVDTLLECWSLLATLKMAQGVGPWLTFPPEGLTLVVGNPRLVWVRDIDGEQSGANHWKGLRELMADQNEGFWENVAWHRHSCDLCRQTIEVDGQLCSIKAAVIDGITNTRGGCGAVHECPHDLPNLSGARFCEHHAPIYEHRCAVTSPECLNDHEDGSLACAEHADMERRSKVFNNFGDYRCKQRMRAAGIEVEPDDIKLLRVMFSRHNSYGHLVGTLNCGIISGISALAAHEGMECVCAALDLMWPDPLSRPGILFYDLACRLLEYRLLHLTWAG